MNNAIEPQSIIDQTKTWVDEVVVGLNLCPFAKPVIESEGLIYQVCELPDQADHLEHFLGLLDKMTQSSSDSMATALLICPIGLADFDEYLYRLDQMDKLIDEAGCRGMIQLASFHPNYEFAGEDSDSVSHYTNRSPWPMFHLIREADITRVMADGADPEAIPRRNIKKLKTMGLDEINRLWNLPSQSDER